MIYDIYILIQAHQFADGEGFVPARCQRGGFDEGQADDFWQFLYARFQAEVQVEWSGL